MQPIDCGAAAGVTPKTVQDATLSVKRSPDGAWIHTGIISWQRELAGDRAGWRYAEGVLSVKADAFGMIPLYVGVADSSIVVGRSASAVASKLSVLTPDDDAIAVLLRLGGFVGGDTFFREVRRLAPGEALYWQQGVLRSVVPPRIQSSVAPDRESAKRQYRELFRAAMQQERNGRPVAIPLSGGRDSRHILAEASRWTDTEVRAVTIDVSALNGSNDHKIALELCRRLGVTCDVLHPDADAWNEERAKQDLLDAECLEHAWFLPLRRWLGQRADTIVYDGLAGDTLSEAKFFTAERLRMLRRYDVTAFAHDVLGHDLLLRRMLPDELYARWNHDRAMARFSREVERHCDAPNPVASFRLENRTRRTVSLAPHRLFDTIAEVRTPYLWPPLASWLLSIEAEFFLSGGFHTETIACAFPEIADVPYDTRVITARMGLLRRERFAARALSTLARVRPQVPVKRALTSAMLLKGMVEAPFGRGNANSVAEMVLWLQSLAPRMQAMAQVRH